MTETTLNEGGDHGGSHWVKRAVAVMFALGLIATLGVVFTRVIAARVPEQRATLEKLIAQRTGLAVRFENVRFSWGLDGTGAVFTRVVLTDPKADRVRVVAPELRVELDTWDLLRHRQFSLGHVTLASPDIEIFGDAETTAPHAAGRGSNPGNKRTRGDEESLIRNYLSWAELMPAGRIEVEGARVHLKRRSPAAARAGAATYSFTLSEAVISRGSSSFNAHGTLLLSQDVGQSLFVSTKLEGLTAGSRVSGDLRVIARRVFLNRLPVAGLSGRGTIDAKLQLRDGRLESGSWQASARDLLVNDQSVDRDSGTRFDHMTVNGRLSRDAQDLLLVFDDLQLTRGARLERAPKMTARLRIDPATLEVKRVSAQAERLPFMATEFLAGVLVPRSTAAVFQAAAGWAPTAGEMRGVEFDTGNGRNAPDNWELNARFAAAALTRGADRAQLSQLQGSLRADARGLTLMFDPGNAAELRMGNAAELRQVSLGGELVVPASEASQGWRFASFTATHGESSVSVDGTWRKTTRAEPLQLELSQVDRVLLLDAWSLLSPGVPQPQLLADLQQATIVEGKLALAQAADGSVNWNGSTGSLTLAELATAADATPRLTAGRGELKFARGAARLKLDAGNVDELVLNGAQLDWPRRGDPRLRVALEGDIGSPLIRQALRTQGLDQISGTVSLDAEARGQQELRRPQLWRVSARLREGTLPVGAGLPAAENLAGTLRFSAGQLRGLQLKGDWLGGPVEVESRRANPRGPLTFTLHGVADAAPLLELTDSAATTELVSGQLAWNGLLEPGEESGSWQVTLSSNLAGIESRLPEPFDKLRSRPVPVTARLGVVAAGIREFTIESTDDLEIHGLVRDGVTTARFEIHGVAGELRRTAHDPSNSELRIDSLDAKRTPAVLAAVGALLPSGNDLDVQVAELRNGGIDLGALRAAIERQESGLVFSLDSAGDSPHQINANGRCDDKGLCAAEFSVATGQLATLLRDVRLPREWPLASLRASGTLGWPLEDSTDAVRSLTGSFEVTTQGQREHQLSAWARISDGQIQLVDVQGTGPEPDQVFRGSGRIGLLARDYDLTVDYERVALATAAVPTPARARLARAWSALRGSAARRGWAEQSDTRRVQWHGTWNQENAGPAQ